MSPNIALWPKFYLLRSFLPIVRHLLKYNIQKINY